MFGYLDLLLDGELDADRRESLVEVRRAADSAAALTRQLLAFSRQQILSPKVLNLSELISDTAPLLRRLIGSDVELVIDLPIKIGSVRADPVQFQQVLLNLIVNARDAMPAGGTLTISTESHVVDAGLLPGGGTMREGRYAVVTVGDTGTGMDAAVRARIFEPFFTTKELGRGTGLGLAMVYGIVKQSDGYIDVASEPNQGTTFRIFLPEAAGLHETTRAATASAGNGAGVILLVEDEDRLRAIVQRWLQRRGYTVFEASSAAEAEERSAALDRIDLLLTDVVMPQVNGYTLASHLMQSRPGIKVLFMTGHVDDAQVIRDIRATELPLVQKPLSAEALLEAVRDALAASSTPAGRAG
jgi:CheY-like chemotaxis protein